MKRSASSVEIVRELMDDVLRSFISNSHSDTSIENQEAEADVESPGLFLSPDREPPVPISRSSPIIPNLGEDEVSSSMSQDGLYLGEEFEEDICEGDSFSSIMKGIEQVQQNTTVSNNHQATQETVTDLADKLPPVGAKRPRQDFDVDDDLGENLQALDKAKRKLDFSHKRKRMSKSKRAGLVFPVSRINSRIKEGKFTKRSGVTAGVYMAGVLEYLVAEVAELAGEFAKQDKKHRITPRHIQLAILSDEEIKTLTKGIIIPQGGVIPWIHPALIHNNNKKK